MKDGIIAETGNSRNLRTVAGIRQLAPTYDAFLELLVKGEFPIDWNGKNPDGWAQQGTELNKANLLKRRKITAAQHRANRIRSFCAEPYGGCAMTLFPYGEKPSDQHRRRKTV